MNVLVVEDDKSIRATLKKGLTQAGYCVQDLASGEEALDAARNGQFDLLVVDVMLPDRDGFSLVEQLRAHGLEMPVLFLTAKRSIEDRVEGLQRGGDDYLTKPYSFSELLARCQALLRRSTRQGDVRTLRYRDLELDLLGRKVRRGGREIELQQKEFALLECFLRNPDRILVKTQILEKVWSYDFDPQTNVVDVLVCRLRTKIDREFPEKLIQTIRGVGYVLRAH